MNVIKRWFTFFIAVLILFYVRIIDGPFDVTQKIWSQYLLVSILNPNESRVIE